MLRVFAEHPDVVLVYSDAVITYRELRPTDRVQSKEGPQGSHQKRPTVVTSTGQRKWPETRLFYSVAS
jgi:hypothetical protein